MSSNAEVIIYSMNKKEAFLKRKGVDLEFNFSIKKTNKQTKKPKTATTTKPTRLHRIPESMAGILTRGKDICCYKS